uniref:ABC transporter permease n=1 Tax=Alloprevotella sp. TaxID=1872471 RepID=UPI003FD89AEC
MNLIWKLLRQHISLSQFAGFFFANLFGMWVVMLGIQFYKDIIPVFTEEDSFINNNFLVVSKHITTVGTLSGRSNAFSSFDIEDVRKQPFCKKVGAFTSSQYKVSAAMSMQGAEPLNTEMFFEAVPDSFVDAAASDWQYKPGDEQVPVILPRTYIALYNFGFAQSRNLPKVSDGLVGMIDMHIFINANGQHAQFKGKVLGFSSRLNTILVPQNFIDWSNSTYEPGKTEDPSRIILEVNNPTDDRIAQYMQQKGYDVEDNKLDAGKTTYFLKVVVSMVMLVGLLVSILSFYILMLSIYLLVQKNTQKLENLLLIGYSPSRVSRPYQLLTLGMNAATLVLAFVLLLLVRNYYMHVIGLIFPSLKSGSLWPALIAGGSIFVLVSIINIIAIRNKVMHIWYRKD